ncbi:putative ankyrin repeat containing protein yar1 protein [Eutypa lata UCREL1]|uniref:Putative ankyrin repeat containing protein yar1 protein n=1 Tax=Eutypa lata (strain UCR-EL1) TaxID=1287681 RepID=M7TNP8_EUTLA|nr:putative ankyrin repeat containing protein yar1 protein [Eutypa lata UCREL1]
MALPKLSEDEVDDLVYLARTGDEAELAVMLKELAAREGATSAEVLEAARDDGQATCLHMAAANGHSKSLDSAQQQQQQEQRREEDPSEQTSYINARNSFGNTALHWACLGGHLDVVKLLLSRGALPATANDKDQIPLDLAAFNSHMHVVDYFLSQSRDIEGDNAMGETTDGEGGLADGVRDVEMAEDNNNVDDGDRPSANGNTAGGSSSNSAASGGGT